jgi:hypothetical protein
VNRGKIFRKTFEKVEGFSFVTPVTGLNRPNTGKEDDDDDDCGQFVICSVNSFTAVIRIYNK